MRLQDIEAIVRALNGAEALYLIVGGLAVVAHGYPRLTVDLDIVLNLKHENDDYKIMCNRSATKTVRQFEVK